jgi:hypothetical protein
MIEHLETQAKKINDVLLTIQKNKTSNRLAKQVLQQCNKRSISQQANEN